MSPSLVVMNICVKGFSFFINIYLHVFIYLQEICVCVCVCEQVCLKHPPLIYCY